MERVEEKMYLGSKFVKKANKKEIRKRTGMEWNALRKHRGIMNSNLAIYEEKSLQLVHSSSSETWFRNLASLTKRIRERKLRSAQRGGK